MTEPQTDVRTYNYFANNRWRKAQNEKTFEVHEPYSGKLFARVAAGSREDARGAVDAAAEAFPGWAETTLSDQYREQLLRTAHRITRNREDAEDAVQDALLRAFVHMDDFEGRSKFGTWLTRITVNSALMILRRKRATAETAMGDNSNSGGDRCYQMTDHAPNPEMRYLQTEEQRILRTAIQRLRPNLRVVVQIHLQGRSMRETAEATGIGLAAAKGRLFHARRALCRLVVRKLSGPRDGAGQPLAVSGLQGR